MLDRSGLMRLAEERDEAAAMLAKVTGFFRAKPALAAAIEPPIEVDSDLRVAAMLSSVLLLLAMRTQEAGEDKDETKCERC